MGLCSSTMPTMASEGGLGSHKLKPRFQAVSVQVPCEVVSTVGELEGGQE